MKEENFGYAFALPRLIARMIGRHPRRVEFSRWEAYGLGILVFTMSVVFAAWLVLPFVRRGFFTVVVLFLLPFAVWVAFLPFYYLNAQLIALFRALGLYRAPTNNPFQHVVIMTWTTWLAYLFLREGNIWLKSLGIFWLGLLLSNLCAGVVFRLRDEP